MSYLWREAANIWKGYCVSKTWWEGVGFSSVYCMHPPHRAK